MALHSDVESVHKDLELCWTQKMADFERRLHAVTSASNPSLLELQEEFRSFKELVTNMFNILGQQVRENARIIDTIDMRSRQKVLLFNGIPEDPKINVEQKVLSLLHDNLGLTSLNSSSLKRCHRIGMKGNDNIRTVLVHFCDHSTKAQVWSLKSKLKGSPISVSEFLTRSRQIVYKQARKHFGMRNVWTLDGTIHIKLPGGSRAKVVSDDELKMLIDKHPVEVQPTASLVSSGDDVMQSGSNINRQLESRRKQLSHNMQAEDKRPRRATSKK